MCFYLRIVLSDNIIEFFDITMYYFVLECRTGNKLGRRTKTNIHSGFQPGFDNKHKRPTLKQPVYACRKIVGRQTRSNTVRVGDVQNPESFTRHPPDHFNHFHAYPIQSIVHSAGGYQQRRSGLKRNQIADQLSEHVVRLESQGHS